MNSIFCWTLFIIVLFICGYMMIHCKSPTLAALISVVTIPGIVIVLNDFEKSKGE